MRSKAITFEMPAGRGRKGERQPRSRRGKQTTSMVVPRNPLPSAPSIRANECENYPDGAQLHESIVPSYVLSTRLSFPWRTFSSSIGVNISSSYTTSSFPSGTPSSVLVYSTRTIGSSRSVALRIVAAFLLPRGLAEKCKKMLWLRRQFFRKIS